MLLLASPARAGCSLEDLGESIYGGLKATYVCASLCADSAVGCEIAIALELALAGAAISGSDTGKGQDLVDQFCAQATGSGDQVADKLKAIFGSSIPEDVYKKLKSVSSASKIAKCSCETEQSVNSTGFDLDECIEDVLCGVLGMGCSCTRPPPQTAACPSIDVKQCKEGSYSGIWNPACIPSGSIGNCNGKWQKCGYGDNIPTVAKGESSLGTLAIQMPPTQEDTGCDPVQSCFCPKPMNATWHEVPNPGSGDHRWVFSCDCPYEADNPDHQTYPGAMLPSGISQCLCYNTNKPAQLGFAPLGMCPPPACPTGQTRIGGECITPCSDPTQGMAFDGSCCDPAQMTSCGQCCPVGTMPDQNSGTCVPKQIVK